MVQFFAASIALALSACLLLTEPAMGLSATNSVTSKSKPYVATAPTFADGKDEPLSAEASFFSPDERSELLNKHLRRELSSQQTIDGISSTENIGNEIMKAALLSAKDSSNGYDPRFGRPALRAYRSFVYSEKYASDPILLDGLAIKTAKQIRNMIKQTLNMAKGIESPPKNQNLQENPPQHFREKIANSIAKGERRARERNNRVLREVCNGCSRPFNLCLCEVLNQWNDKSSNATTIPASEMMVHSRLIVLQHPNEFRKKHTSTVPLLKLLLGEENVRINVGYEFTMKDILLSDDNSDEERPIMLFPGPDAIDLDKYVEMQNQQEKQSSSEYNASEEGHEYVPTTNVWKKQQQKKHTLVLIDGTWSEAKRIIRKSPEILEGCQMVRDTWNYT